MRLFVCLWSLLLMGSVLAQEDTSLQLYEQDAWMLKELLLDTLPDGQVFNRWYESRGPIFWLGDRAKKEDYIGSDLLLMRKGRLFTHVPGTGRLYEMVMDEGSSLRCVRFDSTRYEGYNNAAFTFVYQDTIYSLGGYGFWLLNGHLRFFNETLHSWEIVPLNTKVLAREDGLVSHLSGSGFYYLPTPDFDHGIRATPENPESVDTENRLYFLDLRRKNWHNLGELSEEFVALKGYQQIGRLPWGPLVYGQTGNSYHLYLLNFEDNEILEIAGGEKRARLINMLWYDGKEIPKRIMQYYNNSSIHVLGSGKEKLSVPVDLADFRPVGIRIYKSRNELPTIVFISSGIFLFFTISSGIWLLRKQRSRSALSTSDAPDGISVKWFDELETKLLSAFLENGLWALNIDAVDVTLGTSAKSKDIQNHKRSMVIRSINTKYIQFTGRDIKLITTRRLQLDRRMYEYYIADSERQLLQENLR